MQKKQFYLLSDQCELKLIHRAYSYFTIGHDGLDDSNPQFRVVDFIFHTKPPIEAANGVLALGTGQ